MFDWSLCLVSASVMYTCWHTGNLQKLLWWIFLTASLTHQYLGHYKVQQTLNSSEISAKSSSDHHHISHHHFHPPINSPLSTDCSKIQTIIQQNLTQSGYNPSAKSVSKQFSTCKHSMTLVLHWALFYALSYCSQWTLSSAFYRYTGKQMKCLDFLNVFLKILQQSTKMKPKVYRLIHAYRIEKYYYYIIF